MLQAGDYVCFRVQGSEYASKVTHEISQDSGRHLLFQTDARTVFANIGLFDPFDRLRVDIGSIKVLRANHH